MRMPLIVLAAALLFAASDVPDNDAPQLVAVRGPFHGDAVQTLVRSLDFYGDYGTLAVGMGNSRAVAGLTEAGFDVTPLGDWPEGRKLQVMPVAHAVPEDARVLFETEHHRLVSIADAGAHTADHSCAGHAVSTVLRQAWLPSRGFVAPAGGDGIQALVSADSRIVPLVAQVDGTNVENTVDVLSAYFTRRADSAEILLARDWLVAELEAIDGLTVTTETFDAAFAPNIVAELPGLTHPERVVIVGAHYDSINLAGAELTAPGADDNASGVGGVLELARILSQGEFDNTIRFVLFSAEEFGLVGSAAHASAVQDDGSIEAVAMLNMDMIAHVAPGDDTDLDLITNHTDPDLVAFCQDVAAAYVPELVVKTSHLASGTSDHLAFQGRGTPAAFFFEDNAQFTAAIHSDLDLLGSSANDFVFAERIVKSVLATTAELAQPVDIVIDHTPLGDTSDAGGPYLIAVTATSLTASPVAGVDMHYRVGNGAWVRSDLLAGNSADTWVGSIPGVGTLGRVEYYFVARDADGKLEWSPEGWEPGISANGFEAGTQLQVFFDDFETIGDNGWTHDALASSDDWQRGTPVGEGGDPTAAYSGNNVWANDLGIGSSWNGKYPFNVNNALHSPPMDLSAEGRVLLRFQRWLNTEDGYWGDIGHVEVNGTSVWETPTAPSEIITNTFDDEWVLMSLDISEQAAGEASAQVSFRMISGFSEEYGGWNVDDVELIGIRNGTVAPLVTSNRYISGSEGGSVDFAIDMPPASAGRTYLMLMSVSGTAPGTPVDFVNVPLNFDAVTQLGLGILGSPAVPGFFGTLDGNGDASAALNSPPVSIPGLPGLKLQFAALTMFPADVVTNPVEVEYVP